MKRRHLVMLLGFFSLGGAVTPRRVLALFRRPPPNEHLVRTMAALAELMFPGDGLPGAANWEFVIGSCRCRKFTPW